MVHRAVLYINSSVFAATVESSPLGGLSLVVSSVVLHENHLLQITILDVSNCPVDTLAGDC
jgi:hypothetical protein